MSKQRSSSFNEMFNLPPSSSKVSVNTLSVLCVRVCLPLLSKAWKGEQSCESWHYWALKKLHWRQA